MTIEFKHLVKIVQTHHLSIFKPAYQKFSPDIYDERLHFYSLLLFAAGHRLVLHKPATRTKSLLALFFVIGYFTTNDACEAMVHFEIALIRILFPFTPFME